MSSTCENSCPWSEYLGDTVNKLTCYLTDFLSSTFGLTLDSSSTVIFGNEPFKKFFEFLQELVALLSFDEFQLQLLKIFLFILTSTIALICIVWHVYGLRISEQFMNPSSPSGYYEKSSG
ncbi:hypothetical protein KPH14_008679 [Odynerus spinipes]|uniref:Uncharacterized protein n=1 Tax=Odynerus spinipes TaxID=1348599 RepID=A0AAD9VSD2_9HYME|nr:hypothetical protein KPH14_008679 [Odynerus spinipes]